jgi:DMSO/TMAO reductase YedYZ heme-binding membrane subunit
VCLRAGSQLLVFLLQILLGVLISLLQTWGNLCLFPANLGIKREDFGTGHLGAHPTGSFNCSWAFETSESSCSWPVPTGGN